MNAKPVVVGVDGGPDSIRALEWAAEYARDVKAPLIALTAYEEIGRASCRERV